MHVVATGNPLAGSVDTKQKMSSTAQTKPAGIVQGWSATSTRSEGNAYGMPLRYSVIGSAVSAGLYEDRELLACAEAALARLEILEDSGSDWVENMAREWAAISD